MLSTTFLMITILIIGSMVSFIFQIINIDDNDLNKPIFKLPNLVKPSDDKIIIDDKMDHLMWFIQISDIHISVHFDLDRIKDFETFCATVVTAVKPSVVLATGDLTDSRTKYIFGSTQYKQEWIWYKSILDRTNISSKTIWLDIRGNHDTFNVYYWNDTKNYYSKYSKKGTPERHYLHTLTKGSDKYNFFGFDACLEPSPKRPFNFLGLLQESDIASIKNLVLNAPESNASIWFGHYPTSSIVQPSYGIQNIISGPYLCGHFHTFLGLVNQMYATHSTGFLEAELGDWKDNRIFRVASIDHGLFNFVDVKLNEWPIILITNPKASLYKMDRFEPYHRIANSTHIRVLVFSPYNIDKVRIKIDKEPWNFMQKSSEHFYTLKWDPSKYSTKHIMSLEATDDEGNRRILRQEFSPCGYRSDFTFGSKLALRMNVRVFFQTIFVFTVLMSTIPLFVMRVLFKCKKVNMLKNRSKESVTYKLYFKLFLLSSIDKYFYMLSFIPYYLLIGPWFVGEIIDGHWALCFSWGFYIDKKWLPIGFSYILMSIYIILFHIPMVCTLAHIIHCRYLELNQSTEGKLEGRIFKELLHMRHIIFAILLFFSMFITLSFFASYGWSIFVFGFISIFFIIYLYLWLSTFFFNPWYFFAK